MKVGVVQFEPVFGDVERNVSRAVERVRDGEADLLVLPELALSGYVFQSRDEAMSLSQRVDGEAFDRLGSVAREVGTTVVIGFAERDGDRLYNSSMLLGPGGERAVYRKVQLFCDEKSIFEAGDRVPDVVEIGGVRLGMMICFDWIFPEVARTLALKGADILCHCTNLVLPYCQDAMVTRCLENRVFALTSNRIGTEARAGSSYTFTGRSQVVGPRGDVMVRARADTEETLVVEIDPELARDKSVTEVNDVFDDRRPEIYRL